MPHEPKRRHSRERKGERRHALKLAIKKAVKCPNCGNITLPHIVCKACGFYKGKKVTKTAKK
ncbi:MAG TPA: 50S ribosomal protein L32 [Patescibacteria group bacterium]